jgi:cytochrome c peroxidase
MKSVRIILIPICAACYQETGRFAIYSIFKTREISHKYGISLHTAVVFSTCDAPYQTHIYEIRKESLVMRRHNFLVLAFILCSQLFCFHPAWAEDTHLGLPSLIAPTENQITPAKVALGKSLFFDKRLSRDGSISCAGCHKPSLAFSDGKPLAQGIESRTGTRNTPSLINAAYNTSQFWDGRRDSLESQALDPLLNAREHGLADKETLLSLITRDADYRRAFQEAFGTDLKVIKIEQVAQALASFERSVLVAGNSAFDRYYYGGEKSALSTSAVRGLALFQGAAQCAACHTINHASALFTDNEFHSLSIGLKRIEQRLPEITTRLVRLRSEGVKLDDAILSEEDLAELGRFTVTLQASDIGKFRTPSLRNVALTAPYMHDGSIPKLEDAVELEIYYRGNESGRPLILTPNEKADLVEFLKSLNSSIDLHQFNDLQ